MRRISVPMGSEFGDFNGSSRKESVFYGISIGFGHTRLINSVPGMRIIDKNCVSLVVYRLVLSGETFCPGLFFINLYGERFGSCLN
jgi:hypothetical protein